MFQPPRPSTSTTTIYYYIRVRVFLCTLFLRFVTARCAVRAVYIYKYIYLQYVGVVLLLFDWFVWLTIYYPVHLYSTLWTRLDCQPASLSDGSLLFLFC